MADDTKSSRIRNADTLARRAWIESAMRSVRLHLNASAFVPSADAEVGPEAVAPEPAFEARTERRRHGHLYMAWSEGERRSGT